MYMYSICLASTACCDTTITQQKRNINMQELCTLPTCNTVLIASQASFLRIAWLTILSDVPLVCKRHRYRAWLLQLRHRLTGHPPSSLLIPRSKAVSRLVGHGKCSAAFTLLSTGVFDISTRHCTRQRLTPHYFRLVLSVPTASKNTSR